MKHASKASHFFNAGKWQVATIAAMSLFPAASYASVEGGSVRLSIINYLFLALALVSSLVMFFIFQRRFKNTNRELKDITAELSTTRNRLNESNKELGHTQQDLKST